jgi:hypothetical protein
MGTAMRRVPAGCRRRPRPAHLCAVEMPREMLPYARLMLAMPDAAARFLDDVFAWLVTQDDAPLPRELRAGLDRYRDTYPEVGQFLRFIEWDRDRRRRA